MTTLTVSKQDTLARLINNLDRRIEARKEQVAEFAAQVQKNPVHAFKNSRQAMLAAAQLEVFQYIRLIQREPGEAPRSSELSVQEAAAAFLTEGQARVLRLARTPPASTSPTDNLMEQYVAQAWAEVIDSQWTGCGIGRSLIELAKGD